MPDFDKTGPAGKGPMTGRGFGRAVMTDKELEKRTTQRIKQYKDRSKEVSTKQLKKDTELKQQYLDYYRKTKKMGKTPATWGTWKLSKQTGGSRQLREGIKGLSASDAAEVRKLLGKK
jgi:hypothetical protein